MVGYTELVGRSRAIFHPVGVVEHVRIQGWNHHGFIAPVAELAPETDARLMPSTRQDVELPFGTVAGEELGRRMRFVSLADRHHDVAHADIKTFTERLLNPELLQGHFAATLDLMLELARFFSLNLHSDLVAAMLKLNLTAHGPALAEVIA